MAPAALAMTDGSRRGRRRLRARTTTTSSTQPEVLPAAIPNLLVNGASGHRGRHGDEHGAAQPRRGHRGGAAPRPAPRRDARGPAALRARPRPARRAARSSASTACATPTAPAAARSAPARPPASRTSRPSARASSSPSCPTASGPEKVIEKVKEGVQTKKLTGISDAIDLTDRDARPAPRHRDQDRLRTRRPCSSSSTGSRRWRTRSRINNVALVDGQPRTLGLRELLVVWVEHRLVVVRRRSEYRLAKRLERAAPRRGPAHRDPRHRRGHPGHPHLRRRRHGPRPPAQRVRPVRAAGRVHPRAAAAPPDAGSPGSSCEKEQEQLPGEIAELREILADDARLRALVSDEMAEVAATYGTPRRTILLESAGGTSITGAPAARGAAAPLEIADTPCWVLLSGTGLLARTASEDAARPRRRRAAGQARRGVRDRR